MLKNILVVLFLLLLSSTLFGQNKSAYTPLTDNRCRLDQSSQIPGNLTGVCPGVGGYQLQIAVDDERMSVGVIGADKKAFDLDFWGYFVNFSALGEKAEWRLRDKMPVGLIVRYDVSDQGDDRPPTSYLMVSKIDRAKSCVVAIVKPGKNQNYEARKIADAALNKPCKNTL